MVSLFVLLSGNSYLSVSRPDTSNHLRKTCYLHLTRELFRAWNSYGEDVLRLLLNNTRRTLNTGGTEDNIARLPVTKSVIELVGTNRSVSHLISLFSPSLEPPSDHPVRQKGGRESHSKNAQNKTPGPDGKLIEITEEVFIVNKCLFASLLNTYLKMVHFHIAWRTTKLVHFSTARKKTLKLSIYRPSAC